MSKRIQSKYSVCKKLNLPYKNLWGLYFKDYLRSVSSKKKNRLSTYKNFLDIKQSLKMFYSNIKERSFKYYIKNSVCSPTITLDKLVSLLENRLDTVLFRSCFVVSFQQARQLINHGKITVNEVKIFSSSRKVKKGDIIRLSKTLIRTCTFYNVLYSRSISNYLELDWFNFSIIFLWDVDYMNSYYPINVNYFDILRFYR